MKFMKSYMHVIMSFLDDSVETTSSKKRIDYFNALKPYILDDSNHTEQVCK